MAFETAIAEADVWLQSMIDELGTRDTAAALAALRTGLAAVRDRLTEEELAELAARLPVLVRGLFFEGWSPHARGASARREDSLVKDIARRQSGGLDAERVAAAILRVLARRVPFGRLGSAVSGLPGALALAPDRDVA
jgi:uncharacterized protein (DUF2267 family)